MIFLIFFILFSSISGVFFPFINIIIAITFIFLYFQKKNKKYRFKIGVFMIIFTTFFSIYHYFEGIEIGKSKYSEIHYMSQKTDDCNELIESSIKDKGWVLDIKKTFKLHNKIGESEFNNIQSCFEKEFPTFDVNETIHNLLVITNK
jgi:predicted membrane protein